MKIERFEDIEAWHLARELTRKWIYQVSQEIRREQNHQPPTVNREP